MTNRLILPHPSSSWLVLMMQHIELKTKKSKTGRQDEIRGRAHGDFLNTCLEFFSMRARHIFHPMS